MSATMLDRGRRLVCCTDSPGLVESAARHGFRELDRHSLYVHRSLTRHIFVMERA